MPWEVPIHLALRTRCCRIRTNTEIKLVYLNFCLLLLWWILQKLAQWSTSPSTNFLPTAFALFLWIYASLSSFRLRMLWVCSLDRWNGKRNVRKRTVLEKHYVFPGWSIPKCQHPFYCEKLYSRLTIVRSHQQYISIALKRGCKPERNGSESKALSIRPPELIPNGL